MIESWVEISVTVSAGNVVFSGGSMDEDGNVTGLPVLYKADGFDRDGELIDRHNLWDLVGASYKRTLYPGMTDSVEAQFACPSMSRGRISQEAGRKSRGSRTDDYAIPTLHDTKTGELNISASLWYRKANPEFLDRVYGADSHIRSPVTQMSTAETTIRVIRGEAPTN